MRVPNPVELPVSRSSVPQPGLAGGLYVHVPFCAHKCEYCAFYSHAPDIATLDRYVDALVQELRFIAAGARPETIFFGGGTPSLLTVRQWQRVLDAMAELDLLSAEEFTVECNPATVSTEKARLFRQAGVGRISMGVQSLSEPLLERLGRIHSRAAVFRSFDLLRQAGFDNINLDLMFAIPGQTRAIWRETLDEALSMGSEHLSCYEVIYEEDTPLFAQLQAGALSIDEDAAADMYEELIEVAGERGFFQYEVANFARDSFRPVPSRSRNLSFGLDSSPGSPGAGIPSFACRHNVNYWRGGPFLGLGPSAAGYVDGIRTRNIANTKVYCERLEAGKLAVDSFEELGPLARAGEAAAFGLRMNAGWPFELFRETTGFDLGIEWAEELDRLVSGGFARMDSHRFQLNSRGLRLADWAAEQFLRPEG